MFLYLNGFAPVPALLAFEEDRKRMVKLQQENERYKQQVCKCDAWLISQCSVFLLLFIFVSHI